MKKLFLRAVVFIMFILSATANAEKLSCQEVYRQVKEMGAWNNKIVDNYGREILINADIIMPEIERIPIISAITAENINIEKKEILQNFEVEKKLDEFGVSELKFSFIDENNISVSGNMAEKILSIVHGDEPDALALKSNMIIGSEKNEYMNPNKMDYNKLYIKDSILTLNEILSIAEETANDYFDNNQIEFSLYDVIIYEHPRKLSSINDTVLGDEVSTFKSGYYVCSIRQKIKGIPVLLGINEQFQRLDLNDKDKPTRVRPWSLSFKNPINTIRIIDKDSYRLLFSPIEEKSIIEDNVPICSIDNVISSIEELICDGYVRNVYEIRFGYACFYSLNSEENKEFTLYPVWEVDCEYESNPKKNIEKNMTEKNWYEPLISGGKNYRRLIVNAQTGAIENPVKITRNSYDCPEIIQW